MAEHALETVGAWVAELGHEFGLALELDEGGAVGLGLADGTHLVVEAEQAFGVVHVHAEILRLPADAARRAAQLEAAMVLNLHARRTEGATLGLDNRSDAIVLSITRVVADLDAVGFAGLLGAFVETVATVRKELSESGAAHIAIDPPMGGIDQRMMA